MSDVQQQDFDMIHAKLSQWREDPGVEGFACILIARRTKEDRDKSLNVAVNFHGLWSQRAMSKAVKGALKSGILTHIVARSSLIHSILE